MIEVITMKSCDDIYEFEKGKIKVDILESYLS